MELYGWLILSGAKNGLSFFCFLFFISSLMGIIITCAVMSDTNINQSEQKSCLFLRRLSTFFMVFFLIGLIASMFIPTKSDLAIMFAWDGLQSETIENVIDILKNKLINK